MVFLVRKKVALLSSLKDLSWFIISSQNIGVINRKFSVLFLSSVWNIQGASLSFKSAKRHGCRCRTIRHWSHHTSLLFRRFHPSAIAWRMRNMSGIHTPLSLLISCHIHPPHRVDHIIIKSRVWRSSWGALVIRLQWRIRRQMPWLPKCPNWRGSSIS